MRRFHRTMRREADIPAIQEWLQSPAGIKTVGTGGTSLKEDELPLFMRHLGWGAHTTPQGGLAFVRGSGFGHWGLTVNPKGTPSPASHNVLPLGDGAYVWQDGP
jgi:hypothetical protein